MAPPTGFTLTTTSFRRPTLEVMPVDAKAACLYPNNARMLREAGVTVHETTLTLADFREADEIFSTGNMSKVMPIVALDERKLAVGPMMTKARALYWDWAHA